MRLISFQQLFTRDKAVPTLKTNDSSASVQFSSSWKC